MKVEKFICDICNNECNETQYILPEIYDIYARNKQGVALVSFGQEIKPSESNLCDQCKARVAFILSELRKESQKKGEKNYNEEFR